jgi:hypothetical protein
MVFGASHTVERPTDAIDEGYLGGEASIGGE